MSCTVICLTFQVIVWAFVQLLWSYRRPGNKTTTETFILNSVLVATNGAVVLSNTPSYTSGAWKMHCNIEINFLPDQ